MSFGISKTQDFFTFKICYWEISDSISIQKTVHNKSLAHRKLIRNPAVLWRLFSVQRSPILFHTMSFRPLVVDLDTKRKPSQQLA